MAYPRLTAKSGTFAISRVLSGISREAATEIRDCVVRRTKKGAEENKANDANIKEMEYRSKLVLPPSPPFASGQLSRDFPPRLRASGRVRAVMDVLWGWRVIKCAAVLR